MVVTKGTGTKDKPLVMPKGPEAKSQLIVGKYYNVPSNGKLVAAKWNGKAFETD